MKWKFDDLDKAPELSPDLEWMVQSGQVSRKLLLETLAEAYYPSVYKLAISLTNDSTAAQSVVREIFAQLLLNIHRYRNQMTVEIWVYQTAYRICMRALRGERLWRGIEWWISSPGQFTNPFLAEPPTDLDKLLWRKIDALEEKLRVPLILHYANEWELPFMAQVTGIDEADLESRIKTGLQSIKDSTSYELGNLESKLRSSLTIRWGAAEPPDRYQFINRVYNQSGRRYSLRSSAATVRELMLVGLAILLVLLAIWGGNRYLLGEELLPLSIGSQETASSPDIRSTDVPGQLPDATSTPASESQQAIASPISGALTSTPTPSGVFYVVEKGESLESIAAEMGVSVDRLRQFNRLPDEAAVLQGQSLVIPGSISAARTPRATPVTALSRTRALPFPKTSEDVFNLLNPDELPYNTLWVSAVVLTHESSNPNLASDISQIQFWLSPRQFLLIGGEMGEHPQEVGVGLRGRLYIARPGQDQPWFQRINSRFADPFLNPAILYGLYMLFGEEGDLFTSKFVVIGESQSAGRDSWVVSQLNTDGERVGVLQLDQETGFILRYRRITEPDINMESGMFPQVPDEVVVNSIAFNIDFPQELFDISLPWRGGYAVDHTGKPGYPDPADEDRSGLSVNSNIRSDPLPEGFDPAGGTLRFRFPIGTYKYVSLAGTEIYSDGHYLGYVDMGVPWDAVCKRSPDGQFIVYRTTTSNKDDIVSLSNGPYYLRMGRPLEIRRILPRAERVGYDFAISPDSRTVAIWGCERSGDVCGVYLHDTENHNWSRLIEVQDGAGDFVWSPEGDQLAMRTAGDIIWVVDAKDGEILFASDYDSMNQAPPPGSPMDDWGVSFLPRASGGLEACINPP